MSSKPDSQISQVEGCDFTTDELQQFHRYFRYAWPDHLSNAPLASKIDHFSTHEASLDPLRLRSWLRTMGIDDEPEPTPQQQLYARFDAFDFTTAPGFNELLTTVYTPSGETNKHDIDERMEKAKIQYYSSRVEPIDHEQYRRYKEESKPKPVCPYQHLWEKEKEAAANNSRFEHVKIIDLADYPDGCLTADTLDAIGRGVEEAVDAQYHALAIMRTPTDDAVFLPALDASTPDSALAALRAILRLEIALRKLNAAKPVVVFANGSVDPTALGIVRATAETVLSDNFCLQPSASRFLTAIHSWANLAQTPLGTAEYVLCHPDISLRGSEWQGALALGRGFIGHRSFANAMERILLAASCPPPQTRSAIGQACLVESAYPGPCKVTVWKDEIARYFAPLAQGRKEGAGDAETRLAGLVESLRSVGKPWADRYAAFTDSAEQMKKRAVWIAALEAARNLEYSQVLALEYNLAKAVLSDRYDAAEKASELVDAAIADGPSIADILGVGEPEQQQQPPQQPPQPDALQVEIPGECPFAKMYRKNPQRFQHIDLKSISDHRPLNLGNQTQ
ncbi:hypothetical protein LPJ56_002392 [Coemansia sp. RSA 2599]|nr:hypothetical protein LPJ56_002392 [Coemansia sp. RSA 2599]